MERFCHTCLVAEVIAAADQILGAVDQRSAGDLRCSSGALGHRTAILYRSQAHNVRLRENRSEKGPQLNEYAITRERTAGKFCARKSRRGTVRWCAVCPPELREDGASSSATSPRC